jgi:hypothetical protein
VPTPTCRTWRTPLSTMRSWSEWIIKHCGAQNTSQSDNITYYAVGGCIPAGQIIAARSTFFMLRSVRQTTLGFKYFWVLQIKAIWKQSSFCFVCVSQSIVLKSPLCHTIHPHNSLLQVQYPMGYLS